MHSSDPPNPWAGYKLCLDRADATHICVIQDDAKVSLNFGEAVQQIAETNPDTVTVLYLSWLPRRLSRLALVASTKGQRYVTTEFRQMEFLPVVGVLWPKHKAREFLHWTEANPRRLGHKQPRSDDHVAGRWATFTKQTIRFTVPSIVQHLDQERSLIGRQAHWGRDKGRTALLFAEDASVYSW